MKSTKVHPSYLGRHSSGSFPSTSGMKYLRHQEPDEASPGPTRKQQCRGYTWEEVVRAKLKSEWLTQLDAMLPTIPQLVRENNTRDQKNFIKHPTILNNLIKKREKDAIYCHTQYLKNFPEMGEILDLIKKKYPNFLQDQNNSYISCLCQYRATFTIVKRTNPYVHNFAYPYFSCYSKGGEKLTVKNVPCTSIFMILAVIDVSLFLSIFSNIFHFVSFALCFALFLLCELHSVLDAVVAHADKHW